VPAISFTCRGPQAQCRKVRGATRVVVCRTPAQFEPPSFDLVNSITRRIPPQRKKEPPTPPNLHQLQQLRPADSKCSRLRIIASVPQTPRPRFRTRYPDPRTPRYRSLLWRVHNGLSPRTKHSENGAFPDRPSAGDRFWSSHSQIQCSLINRRLNSKLAARQLKPVESLKTGLSDGVRAHLVDVLH